MSIATELTRIQGAKADLKTAIENKGVTVSSSALIDDYPALVNSIPTGGGSEEKDVNFYDYDGTLLYSYTTAEAQALTALPDAPDHSEDDIPLVFDRWNYTLEGIQEELEDVGKATVGANYHTLDGFTHLVWKVEAGEKVRINSVSSGATIDWGDGETTTGQTSGITHTYTNAGVYDCKVSGTSITVGNSNSTYAKYCARLSAVRLSQSVTSIEGSAFYNCCSLQSITIPHGVTSIGSYLLYNCYSLQSITIPNSVTSIGERSFFGCSGLTSITIPNSVTSIEGFNTFYRCYSLRGITIPRSVTDIGGYTFSGCRSLQSATISGSVTRIGELFNDCPSLQSVTISGSVTSIASRCFEGCTSLQSVTIPDSVTSIGGYAFKTCSSLRGITIPQGVTSIVGIFSECTLLQSITIPQGVTSIGKAAFYNCCSLQSITIPDSVTSIGEDAFYECTGLQGVTIPDSVTSIGSSAFYHCYFETLVFESAVPPTVSSTNSFQGDAITKIIVPKGSLEAYQNATNLSQLAGKMVEADE